MTDRTLSAYDGRDRVSTVTEYAGCFGAYNAAKNHLGSFPQLKAASDAVSFSRPVPRVRDIGETEDW